MKKKTFFDYLFPFDFKFPTIFIPEKMGKLEWHTLLKLYYYFFNVPLINLSFAIYWVKDFIVVDFYYKRNKKMGK